MWFLGMACLAMSAFTFANMKILQTQINHRYGWIIKSLAVALFALASVINASEWGLESAIALTISTFCIASFIFIFFKLDSIKGKKQHA